MTQKDIVATALEQVEKEKQEAEISKIKGIVKAYLEKILNKKEVIKEAQKELKELEADLDDLKAGRLDKIEERQEKDPTHNAITIIFVRKVIGDFLPYYPWRSPYIIEWKDTSAVSGTTCGWAGYSTTATSDGLFNLTTTGTMFQNFSGGTYSVNGQVFNL